jgi:hypothetical protein
MFPCLSSNRFSGFSKKIYKLFITNLPLFFQIKILFPFDKNYLFAFEFVKKIYIFWIENHCLPLDLYGLYSSCEGNQCLGTSEKNIRMLRSPEIVSSFLGSEKENHSQRIPRSNKRFPCLQNNEKVL